MTRPSPAASAGPELWDADLLIGRDPVTTARVTPSDIDRWLDEAGIGGGLLASQRAIVFDAMSGNAEAASACDGAVIRPVVSLEARDFLGSRQILEATAPQVPIRLAPNRQDTPSTAPGFQALVRRAVERGHLLLCEGDIRDVGPVLAGLGARVIFLDTHFYALGDFVALAETEPGFMTSIRLLTGPDSLEQIRDTVGVGRMVFGSRNGFHEGRSVLETLHAARLSDDEKRLVAAGTLRALLGETS